ncbi:hypothetical protein D9615_002309 [Tricholomella constricta]|uniref:Uncharacterized protein n=1 Tax=Tricholomella constricta TaxID=117010 RepID=A0A8H5HMH9_9AGAR|nr:hypothetical protein D9615_002309 [Tricholomella constricta]
MQPTLVTPRLYNNRPSSKEKPKVSSIIIPPTQINAQNASFVPYNKYAPPVQVQLSSTATPPSSASASPTSSPEADMTKNFTCGSPADVVAIAELFATLKQTVSTLHSTFDRLGTQAEKMAQLAPAMKIKDFSAKLENQIASHTRSMQGVRYLLEDAIKNSLVDHLKSQLYDAIRESVAREVQQRVQQELKIQIPKELRVQVQVHQRYVIEVLQTSLHNSDARRHNASLRSPCMTTEPLRPLLRPLPSALQSPAYALKRPFTANSSAVASPMTAFPEVPAPTPLLLSAPALMIPAGSNQVFELIPPTPSPLFPRDLRALFALGPDAAKRLLQDYGLDSTASAAPSPKTEKPGAKAALKTGLNTPEDSPMREIASASREEHINKFMAHIGVPFLMIPTPKPKNSVGKSISPSLVPAE